MSQVWRGGASGHFYHQHSVKCFSNQAGVGTAKSQERKEISAKLKREKRAAKAAVARLRFATGPKGAQEGSGLG